MRPEPREAERAPTRPQRHMMVSTYTRESLSPDLMPPKRQPTATTSGGRSGPLASVQHRNNRLWLIASMCWSLSAETRWSRLSSPSLAPPLATVAQCGVRSTGAVRVHCCSRRNSWKPLTPQMLPRHLARIGIKSAPCTWPTPSIMSAVSAHAHGFRAGTAP